LLILRIVAHRIGSEARRWANLLGFRLGLGLGLGLGLALGLGLRLGLGLGLGLGCRWANWRRRSMTMAMRCWFTYS
jgi:hypothetical protein